MKALALTLALALLTATCLPAKDWTRFRGDNGQGISSDRVPLEWSAEKNLKWILDLPGMGSSSAVVAAGKVFVTCFSGVGEGATDTSKLVRHLICVDRKTGKQLWEKKVANEQQEDPYGGFIKEHGYASNTPVVHDGKVYAFFGKSGLHAFDLDGRALWNKNLGTSSTRRKWGSAASPIVVGDTLVVSAAEEDLSVYGLDLNDGHLYWASDTGYACCAEAESGEIVFRERLDARGKNSRGKPFYAAAVAADGKVICVSRWGGTIVFEAKPEFKQLAHNKIEGDESQFNGTPAISDGQLFLRSDKALYCIGE